MNKQRRILLIVVAAIAAVFFGGPTLKEGVTGECEALSARVFQGPMADKADDQAAGLMKLFAGSMATAMVTLKYPNVPSGVSCAALYWRTLYDPDYATQLRQ